MADPLIDEIIDFWFDEEAIKPYWFKATVSFDRMVAERVGETYERAAAGELDHWADDVDGCLALCILLDQVPRNIYRGTPQAFATDDKARRFAAYAIDNGYDLECSEEERTFFYLPFEHHEDPDSQRLSVILFTERVKLKEQVLYAQRHADIIARFGRFPHRNAILGRVSTPEEEAFLKEPDSSF